MESFEISKHRFSSEVLEELGNTYFADDYWPIVYLLSAGPKSKVYVGETADVKSRLHAHLQHDLKKKLTEVRLITSHHFNKSATLDIESNLIRYLSGDGQFELLNANIGVSHHNYYQKDEVYWKLFNRIWDKLRSEGIAIRSVEEIDNSDLFKYSPYKSLSHDQRTGLLNILDSILDPNKKTVLVEGGAGTGKTILALFLFKLLNSNYDEFKYREFEDENELFVERVKELKKRYGKPKMGLVVPMSSFRNTLKKIFSNVAGLEKSMVIGPAEVTRSNYDILVVDESHRLRQRKNLGSYFRAFDDASNRLGLNRDETNELEWVNKQSVKSILFYDPSQSIKPSDVPASAFEKLRHTKGTELQTLVSQFRVKAGNGYSHYIDQLIACKLKKGDGFEHPNYEFALVDDITIFRNLILEKNESHGLSRMIAGYSWKWISKKDPSLFDINIEGLELRWNTSANDWINHTGSEREVGCIHTTQGYDLNYAGIIFGHEITYNKEEDRVEILKENYFDRNGKVGIQSDDQLRDYILNIYKTIMLRGIHGTFVYVCDPSLRAYFKERIPLYKKEETEDYHLVEAPKLVPFVNAVPLYDLKAAAGNFSDPQIVEDSDFVYVGEDLNLNEDYFATQVVGESMNRIIPNGSICLFRKDKGGSRNGLIVLVESQDIHDSDTGASYTVKEYRSEKMLDEHGWAHKSISLNPLTENPQYKSIVLNEESMSEMKVIGRFVKVISS